MTKQPAPKNAKAPPTITTSITFGDGTTHTTCNNCHQCKECQQCQCDRGAHS